jgi:hypothetical protein
MHHWLTLSAGCLAALLLAGCGGSVTHVVERPGLDAATQASLTGAAQAAQPSDAGPSSSPPAINTPPEFPPNYRTRIAVMLALEHRRGGKGPPEITDLQSSADPLGAGSWVCVQFPVVAKGLFGPDPTRTDMRRIRISAARSVISLGQVQFSRQNLGLFDTCAGEMKPFVELAEVAQKLDACQAKGESRCIVNDEPRRRDTLILPANFR